jgi:hypothetical protein
MSNQDDQSSQASHHTAVSQQTPPRTLADRPFQDASPSEIAFNHVFMSLLGVEDANHQLIQAFSNESIEHNLSALFVMHDSEFERLEYRPGGNRPRPIAKGHAFKLRALKGFAHYLQRANNNGQALSPEDWLGITKDDFDTYRSTAPEVLEATMAHATPYRGNARASVSPMTTTSATTMTKGE